ncbi:hypothetical protein [Solidesulfovibrio sp.]|uniref:hypothetical protein n=1 Tax=Solidesulfovibrio sp. TaxID=2910990 RepID=UPI002B1F3ABD|nr:hypothetical protein [Solidesulfovibrio sp.]MEA5088559.1 hypothetical protein [Solidesulfovibrio sp.]
MPVLGALLRYGVETGRITGDAAALAGTELAFLEGEQGTAERRSIVRFAGTGRRGARAGSG